VSPSQSKWNYLFVCSVKIISLILLRYRCSCTLNFHPGSLINAKLSSTRVRIKFRVCERLFLCYWDTGDPRITRHWLLVCSLFHSFQKWLSSYKGLFTEHCEHCHKILKIETEEGYLLPPCWRDTLSYKPYHSTCRWQRFETWKYEP